MQNLKGGKEYYDQVKVLCTWDPNADVICFDLLIMVCVSMEKLPTTQLLTYRLTEIMTK